MSSLSASGFSLTVEAIRARKTAVSTLRRSRMMKKKGLLFLLICMTLAFCVALSACSLVQVNEERQANRVMATVTVDLAKEYGDGVKVLGNDWDYTVSMDITRRELISTVNYAINYYSQLYATYGMTYSYDIKTLLDSALKTLKSQKYNTICAMGELLAESKSTGRFDALYCRTEKYAEIYGKTLVPEGVLTVAERYSAINTINDQFTSQLETYLGESKDEERDREKSEANDSLAKYYADGYFVAGVSVANKGDNGEYADGLYAKEVVDDGDEDTAELDYTKVYSKVRLVKTGEEDVYVYVPIEEENLTVAEDEGAVNAKYLTAKTATVTYSGRVYAEVTEDNDSGYDIESFTSEAENYTLISARSVPSEEEEESSLLDALRYITNEVWADESSYTEDMTEFKAEIFNPNPDSFESNEEKDAYRQLRNTFNTNNIGYVETDPGKENVSDYRNYKFYNGLQYYYDSQFSTVLLNAKNYEIGAKITEATPEEIAAEYSLLVLKDKANYEYLTAEEQVKKFFDTIKGTDADGLSKVYYVPIDALCSVSYEIDPTEKAYAPLFTLDAADNVVSYNTTYVTEENGKYTMKYAYDNGDGTYTINMIFVTHVLLSFDNVPGLADQYKEAAKDFTDEQKMVFIKLFAEKIKTCPQLESYIANYDKDKTYKVSDVFATDENGNLKYQTYAEAESAMNAIIQEAFATGSYQDLLDAFIRLTEIYDDDGGKLTDSGYLVSAGEMENGWYEDFTATALNIYFGLLNDGYKPTGYEQADGTNVEDRIKDAYSDYGVHKMFISFAPLYNVKIDDNGAMAVDTVLNLDGLTRWDEIGKSLVESKRTKAYSDWTAKLTEEKADAHTVVNEKYYNRVVKEVTD